jgi:DNA-binding LacI/PurR family transcriptional regulator
VDERHAGQLATQHLIDLGHRRIGFVAGPEDYLPTLEKAAGRAEALREAGLSPDGLVAHGDFSIEGGRVALRELLERDSAPTGVVCSSDLMAFGVLKEARALGLRVPEELSIVGFDGIEAGIWLEPPLTTIEQPIERLAETAVEALQTLIAEPGRSLPSFVFKAKLRQGGSTAPPAR